MNIKIGYSFFTYVQIYRRANGKQTPIEATASFHSFYFSLASIQLVFSLFCLHFHRSVSFKHRFYSLTCLLVPQKLSSAMFSLRMYFINNFRYTVQYPRSTRSNSAGCACKISALMPFIIPYAPVSNTYWLSHSRVAIVCVTELILVKVAFLKLSILSLYIKLAGTKFHILNIS